MRHEENHVQFDFVPATKAGSKARIALMGIAGSGKTYTALKIAQGLDRGSGDIGLIDTDRASARLYADTFAFRWMPMTTFDPADLIRATLAAAEQGIGVLILDTWSPFWGGAEGMLDKVGAFASSFEGWRQMRPIERRMTDALLSFPGHVIVTLRMKTEYVVEVNDKGKHEPKRVGLKPEQREGLEHEFDVVADLEDAGRTMRISKTRCPELAGASYSQPGEAVGETIQAWLDRDAIGEPLNPGTVRAWAMDDARTQAELRERFLQLEAAGQSEAVVYDIDAVTPVGIGVFLQNRARVIKQNLAAALQSERPAA